MPVPPRRDVKAWQSIRSWYFDEVRDVEEERRRRRIEHWHAIEKEIARLEAMATNPGRRRAIHQLKKDLAKFDF